MAPKAKFSAVHIGNIFDPDYEFKSNIVVQRLLPAPVQQVANVNGAIVTKALGEPPTIWTVGAFFNVNVGEKYGTDATILSQAAGGFLGWAPEDIMSMQKTVVAP